MRIRSVVQTKILAPLSQQMKPLTIEMTFGLMQNFESMTFLTTNAECSSWSGRLDLIYQIDITLSVT